jgi:hypothetical protein
MPADDLPSIDISPYPLIRCGAHELALAYIVCTHIMAGAPIAHLIEPADEPGEALCAACHAHELSGADLDVLRVVCIHCFRGRIAHRAGGLVS